MTTEPPRRPVRPAGANFEGHAGRECGEHRSVGPHRAWCFECHEWCYPRTPCKGCAVPMLEAEIERLTVALERAERLAEGNRALARYYLARWREATR